MGFKCESLKITDCQFFLEIAIFKKRNIKYSLMWPSWSHATNAIIRHAISSKSRKHNHHYHTAYLGMTQGVSGQFPCIENVRCGDTAKRNRKESKEHHNLTKGELGYTLIPVLHTQSQRETRTEFRGPRIFIVFFHIHVIIIIVVRHKKCSQPFSPHSLGLSSSNLLTAQELC